MYKGVVIRNETFDPEYRVRFSFNNERYEIPDGTATFRRKAPVPTVAFDDLTDYRLEKQEVDEETVQNIKLEIGKTVCDFIFSTMELKKI